MSELCKAIENFMIDKQLEKEKNYRQYLLLQALNERSAVDDFPIYYKKTITNSTKQIQNTDAFFHQYLYKELLYEFSVVNREKKASIDLWQILDSFKQYSLLNQLRYACAILNAAKVRKQELAEKQKSEKMLDELMLQVQTYEEKESMIALYYAVLCFQKSQLEGDFFHLKKMLFAEESKLDKDELSFITTIATNYCNRKIRAGDSRFYAEMFELYQYMLQEGLFEIDGFINPRYAKNLVILGLKAEKFAWVKDFIESYKEKVTPKWSDSVYHFNLGVYFFYKKEYQQALQYLCLIERFDVFFELDYRILMLKIYYESAETFAFNALLLSFRKYVDRQTYLTEDNKKSYYNFLKWSKFLFSQKINTAIIEPQKIEEIKESTFLAERNWLLEKTKIS